MTENLFNEFPHASKQEWIELATKDLNGQDFERRLITKNVEGFSDYPFYTAEDIAAFSWLQSYNNMSSKPSDLPGMPPRIWHNAVIISVTDLKTAVEEIQFVLDNGADAIVLELEGKVDFHALLKNVLPQYIQIWIKPTRYEPTVLEDFFSWYRHKDIKNTALYGGFLWDFFSQALTYPLEYEAIIHDIHHIHDISRIYPNFKGLCLDASVYHHAGGHAVQDVGYSLALAVDILDSMTARGIAAVDFFKNFFVKSAVGTHYFMELAKIKTLRIAFHQLSKIYEVDIAPADIFIFAETSMWSKSALDPYNNIIRNTSEAMAAIIGGCNTLLVHPHDSAYHQPDTFSKRMARNVSSILKEESYFDKVIDPSAGSYYVSSLINNLYQDALQLLKDTETLGGWWAAYQKHILQETIRQVRKTKHGYLSTRKIIQVGVNQYVNASEDTALEFIMPKEEEYQLYPHTLSDPYIEMKINMEVFFRNFPQYKQIRLLALSPGARPRTEFAKNFFETAGFVVNESKGDFNVLGKTALSIGEHILVLCGTDEDYEKQAVQVTKTMQNSGKLLILAGYPDDLVTALIESGLRTFIHLKTNVTETILQLTEDLKCL
ncbi:methylmalonyl-CoA mutase family protein [Anditalea andensis]|uniref:Methylmalonyl-CoA mutase alpha/beta chain catalytic domain-containing protein n=1 Tax=Anditalea andensis TaxID=1048983 RepID=A0A074KXV0_9BACT|nr:methylmalonyl-CoA mutase family protein [Anditalea andensis]KEO74801.1 hypothetical protein EL17_03745 [Anditalea andensis]